MDEIITEALGKAWDVVKETMTFLASLPCIAVALIGAGLLHGAMFALELIDPMTPEKEGE